VIEVYKAEEHLKFLNRGRKWPLSNSDDTTLLHSDAFRGYYEPEEVNLFCSKRTFFGICIELVLSQPFEDLAYMLCVLFC
jgi:hypothetical protein